MASAALSQSVPTRDSDPTQQLREALARFESILTDDQRQKFKINNARPDTNSVVKFIKEIDNTNKTTMQCVGPRISTFLGRVQEFTSIVDTFVSSHPEIAALVWGGVKTAILAVSNIASYFDKVTSLIMDVGRSCPTYQQFGQLYHGCVNLKSALCGYYAIIVSLCIKIIEVSRRPPLQQTFSAFVKPFESEFKDFIDNLAKAAREIEQQISLASKQDARDAKKLLELESQKNSIFQRTSKTAYAEIHDLKTQVSLKEAARLRIRIRNNLSTIDYDKYCNRARRQRVKGTAEWLLREPIFHEWQNDKNTAILWCPGTMGAGKTVLMSHVVTHLLTSDKTNETIAYYFCRADDAASLSVRNIIGSLARQILDTHITDAQEETLLRLSDASNGLSTSEITDIILPRLQIDKKYYLVIDGLDECETSEVREVARSVTQLCNTRAKDFKVLYSGLPELEGKLFGAISPKYRIPVTESNIGSEMDRYIAATLDRCIDEEELVLGDARLKAKIQEALRKGSNGMFLWARLFIEELCAQGSDNEILEALKHPPRLLSEIFDRKLSRVRGKTARDDAFRVLQYCGVMKRPLTMMEYKEALSLSPGQKSLDRGNFPNDMNRVISHCCGLTCVDEEDNTVHYVHQSVKQHFFPTNNQQSEEFNAEKLDRHIGVLCMTYLDFTDLKRRLKLFEHTSNTPIQPVCFEFHFLEYARNYWINHLADLQSDPHNANWSLFRRCLEGDDIVAYTPWESAEQIPTDKNEVPLAIQWLSAHGNCSLLRYYERHQSHLITRKAKHHIFQSSAIHGHPRLTGYIFQLGPIPELMKYGLLQGSRVGCIELIDGLLQFVTNGDTQEVLKETDLKELLRTSLRVAAKEGHVEVVRRLFAEKANSKAPRSILDGRTALEQAAGRGHLKVVELLLAAKTDIHAISGFYDGRTALEAATAEGHLEIVERLLAAKAEVDAPAMSRPDEDAPRSANLAKPTHLWKHFKESLDSKWQDDWLAGEETES
ncbi:unnamed protein product [Penicillium salamii]|nr:unnamed protein product [Penicillium salamii]CAG8227600.1 unnamed protein product [Penicillium salamii]